MLTASSTDAVPYQDQDPCDPDLAEVINLSNPSNPHAYRLRDDGQCEGTYSKPVSGTNLSLVSLTRAVAIRDFADEPKIKIDWAAPPGTKRVHLRAEGLGEVFYRMDAIVPGGRSAFQWSSLVLSELRQSPSQVGMLGWIEGSPYLHEGRVHLPLSVQEKLNPRSEATDSVYLATIILGVRVREIHLSLATAGPNGLPESYLSEDVPLGGGYYPVGRPIRFPVAGAKSEGTYYLGISATAQNGSTAAAELLFYHPGF